MDRVIYTAMNGAARLDEHQAVLTNNMANVNTPGFREQFAMYRSVPLTTGTGMTTRVATVASTPGHNFQAGVMQTTGRALDVAISGEGWFAIEAPGGGEAYTRAGNFQVGIDNVLRSAGGQAVLSEQNAPIAIPENARVTIGTDGTLTAIGAGDQPNAIVNLGRLKLVVPDETQLVHGDDGYFRLPPGDEGQPAAALPGNPALRVISGMLEGSNANPMTAMVGMIENSRRYEAQMQVLKNVDTNEQRANGILSAS
ncbi:MAG: flagellar basal body rod protein FlgF [Burkholderiaceae bacterium]|nr:flagellar basal body rod protein FlgF [Burkholderiaceae bacterium]